MLLGPTSQGVIVKLLSMLSNRVIKAPLLWCLLACLMLRGVVWLLGQRLSGIELAPDQGASWYYWKLPHPTAAGRSA